MKKETKKSSGLPLSIIALVFVLVVIGGFWFYNTSRPATTPAANRATATSTPAQQQQAAANAPLGAPVGVNMLGSPSAAVTIEEFADYQCGACASIHPTMKEVQTAYAGNRNFRFIFRHYPLSIPAHDKSYDASVATEAAGLQGKFWQMQDQLFRNQQAWTANPNYRDIWVGYAENIGMNAEKFKSDLAGLQTKARVDADLARGRALSVTSTPSIFVNGRLVPFAEVNTTSLRRIIDAEIQQAGTQTPGSASNNGSANTQ
ncbi:hypothetical protein BH24ACI3_BH24ACI3_04710 [soil metagenome]